jgi:methyltransferase family protein
MLRRNRVSQHLLGSLGTPVLSWGGPTRRWQDAAERFGVKTIVLNIDMNHLTRFRTLYHRPNFVVLGDATRIPLKDNSVDYVISYALLEHIAVERRPHLAKKSCESPGRDITSPRLTTGSRLSRTTGCPSSSSYPNSLRDG